MTKILAEIEKQIALGTIIPKPQAKGSFKVKEWGTRRGERALIYTVPSRKTPSKPYRKGITESEWVSAFDQLKSEGEFTRDWFEASMPACAKDGACNFTTIGGIFQLLGYADYERGAYRASE